MAKLSAIEKNKLRIELASKLKKKRDNLRDACKKGSYEEKVEASIKLQKLPRDSSQIRVRDRCNLCGRPRGTLKKFGLCRIHLREALMRGDVPGLKKASW